MENTSNQPNPLNPDDLSIAKTNQIEKNTEVSGFFKWLTISGSILAAIGGSCLHLIGTVSNETYYRKWGLDSADFRIPTDEALVRGYEAIWAVFSTGLLRWISNDWMIFILYGLLGVASYFLINLPEKKREAMANKLKKMVENSAIRHSAIAGSSFFIFAGIIPISLVFVMIITLLPLSIAKQYGGMAYNSTIKEFVTNCPEETKDFRCVTLRKEGQVVSTGYIIGISEKFIAMYEPNQKRVALIERPGNIALTLPFEVSTSN